MKYKSTAEIKRIAKSRIKRFKAIKKEIIDYKSIDHKMERQKSFSEVIKKIIRFPF